MKPGEEWTDPATGKVYVCEKTNEPTACDVCAFLSRSFFHCIDLGCIATNLIFKAKEEKP